MEEKRKSNPKRDWNKAIQNYRTKATQPESDAKDEDNEEEIDKPFIPPQYTIFTNFILVLVVAVILTVFSEHFYLYFRGFHLVEGVVLTFFPAFLISTNI